MENGERCVRTVLIKLMLTLSVDNSATTVQETMTISR